MTIDQLLNLPDPPEGLTEEELRAWWLRHLAEPDGTIIMRDDYVKTPADDTALASTQLNSPGAR